MKAKWFPLVKPVYCRTVRGAGRGGGNENNLAGRGSGAVCFRGKQLR